MELREIAELLYKSSLRGYTREYLAPKFLELIKLSRKDPQYNTLEGAKTFCKNNFLTFPGFEEGVYRFVDALFGKMLEDDLIICSTNDNKIITVDEDKIRKLFYLIFTLKNRGVLN